MPKVKIILNGEETMVDQSISIETLIRQLNLDSKKIAVEKDGEIADYSNFSEIILSEGNRIEIVHFIGGG